MLRERIGRDYRAHYEQLVDFASRFTRNREDARDAVQDAVLSSLTRYRSEKGEWISFMFKSIQNSLLNRYKSERIRNEQSDEYESVSLSVPPSVYAKMELDDVLGTIGLRELALLAFGFTQKEISRVSGFAPSSINRHVQAQMRRVGNRTWHVTAPRLAPSSPNDAGFLEAMTKTL